MNKETSFGVITFLLILMNLLIYLYYDNRVHTLEIELEHSRANELRWVYKNICGISKLPQGSSEICDAVNGSLSDWMKYYKQNHDK